MNKTISKVTALLAVLVVAVCAMPAAVSADSTTLKGSGTQNEPYVVTTAEQLQELNKQDEVGYVQLGADIDMNGVVLDNKTYVIKKLTGEFDGKGHTISNLKLEGKANTNTGLISELTGNITEVALENIDITDGISNNSIVGTLAGYIPEGSSVSIDKCIVTGNISNNISGTLYIGGLVGCIEGTINSVCTVNLTNCISDVEISYKGNYAGGLIGYAKYYVSATISRCAILGNVTSNASSCKMGGIIGYFNSSEMMLNIVNVCLSGKLEKGKYGIGYSFATPKLTVDGFYYDNEKNKPKYSSFELLNKKSELDLSKCYPKTTAEMKSLKLDGFEVVDGKYDGYPVPVWKTSGGDEPITYSITLDDSKAKAVVSAAAAGTYCVVFAAYNSDTLTSVDVVKQSFTASANQTVTASVNFKTDGATTVKAMLLRSLEDIYPLCEAAQK